ncbi:hypothetical protein [Solicola gregarius]|uniref:DUF559 domain-containing protein n=1 Tax=Solicola gregarius TaxID=2908642 RepID=A0AA46TKT7_9ACTN|nr:hypothetical protein [Solicola gregarius]UYM06754.1 hypothetical protein L0C25_06690 [Solicola gregarius]
MQPIRHRDRAERGLTQMQLRHPRWWHPTDGVSMPREDAASLVKHCAAIRLALADNAVFTHVTSAQLRGWWLPSGMRDWPVIACTDGGSPHHDRRGVYVRRCAIPSAHRHALEDLPTASSEWTILELAEDLSLIDLVVAIDSALHLGDCTMASLDRAVVPGRRGVKRLRRAMVLADGRSESAWETILRLVHVLSGITDVEPQACIRDAAGTIVARADLRLGTTRRLSEYDGAVHRDGPQHRADLRREKLLIRIGFERFGYTASEIHREASRILLDAEGALGLRHDPRRIQGWLVEYRRSSLTPGGRDRLAARMHRFVRDISPRSTNS